jgi:hypothetical protein
MSNKRTSMNITPYKMPQGRILYNGARNDYPAFWNRFCQKLSEDGIYYVLEPNYRRLTIGNAPTFPAMPELNAMGQMDPVVRHAHEERMENYKIHMRSYYTEAARKLDRDDCGTATGILLSLLSPSILSRVTSERNIVNTLWNSLVMSNYSFFHKSIRLPLVILNLRAFSSKSSYFIFNNISLWKYYVLK